ncbi:BAR-domain-containing protein [Neolentinus lepideus HHB14362 ss-1]|uniref:BAR-domain-containing protein n=1 Tax=Neolentinus lepideus HHB14362 ss-1 TaxID=1314782 RepID=A0A165S4V2_9AGAM|nr:BAR-domain-containing protein [Neolentinus lepideus HHB14362 ss-1]
MKGITKAIKRTPHLVTSKVGMSKKSIDPEFDDYQRRFGSLEQATEKLLKDTKAFTDAVNHLFMAGASFSTHFATIFHPIAGEYDLLGKHSECAHTIKNVDSFNQACEELRTAVSPELELIESRVVGPLKELQGVLKTVRKTITKREHKLTDYDRFNNSLTKLRDKKEKSLSDEKNLFKLEQDFENASTEYDYINTALKNDLPRFMTMCTQFIDPLFQSFFYMQLNIFYLLLEKIQGFSEGKYDTSTTGAQISEEYETKRSDAWQTIEALHITQRIISTSKMVQQARANGGLSPSPSNLNRSVSATSSGSVASRTMPPPSRSVSGVGYKKAPPPAPGAKVAEPAPPPYSPPASAAAAAAKRAPPPPPPLKPKPKAESPAVQYVVALYDFEAQADGDLSFNAGDRIELVERTTSQEDWWTGRVNDRQGVFPGNYVQEA